MGNGKEASLLGWVEYPYYDLRVDVAVPADASGDYRKNMSGEKANSGPYDMS